MSRRAFTLVELMISIALTTIVVLFLYKALSNQEIANRILAKNAAKLTSKERLYELLYRDLIQADRIEVKPLDNKDFTLLFLHTTNSLHAIPKPYVVYFVHERNATLVRLESAYEIKLPVESERVKYIFADPLVEGVERFLIQVRTEGKKKERRALLPGERAKKSKKKKSSSEYLLYLKWQKEQLLLDLKK